MLLQNGADVNATDYNADTPLSWAAMKGNLQIVKTLLEYNARVDTRNNSGHSPLYRLGVLVSSAACGFVLWLYQKSGHP